MINVFDALSQISLAEFSNYYIFIAAGLFMRVSAFVFLLPGLGERTVPARVRLVAAAALSIVLFPIVLSQDVALPESVSAFTAVLIAEALNGLMLGFATRIFVFTLQLAGAIIAQNLSLSQLFGPGVGFDSESPFAAILVMAGIALAMTSGLHYHLAGSFAAAYEVFGFGVFPGGDGAGEWSAMRTGAAFTQALALASPFVILGFIYSISLAAASRAMPQLPAAFVGAPAIVIAGAALFAATAPILLIHWLRSFQNATFDLFAITS